jgi:hypothetical protein
MKILPVRAEFHADGQTEMRELIFSFHNFANVHKMLHYIRTDTLLTIFLLNFVLPLRHVIKYVGYSGFPRAMDGFRNNCQNCTMTNTLV